MRTPARRQALSLALAVLFLLGLVLMSRWHFLLFHTLVELISIAIAGGIFVLAWNSRRMVTDSFLLVLGTAYLAVGAMDLLHALAYKGMDVFVPLTSDLPTQLWIAARYLQSVSLLFACFALRHRVRSGVAALGYAAATGLLFALIFGDVFPHCYVEGKGLTPFKIVSEYAICVVFACGIICLQRKRSLLDATVRRYVIASIVVTIASEITFTQYVGVYGPANVAGHLLKLIAFYLMYKAIIEGGLARPYSLLFRDLKQSEESLRRQRDFISAILSTAGALILVVDREGRVVEFNQACEKLTGYRAEEARGRFYGDLVGQPQEIETRHGLIEEITHGRALEDYETVWTTREGQRRNIAWWSAALRDERGEVQYMIGCGVDVTERNRALRDLRQLLSEKELLLDELHHRVKNNLQIVAGLLDLARRRAGNEGAQQVLRDAESKVNAMALIHEETARETRLDRIDFAWYLRRLTRYLMEAYGPEDGRIRITVEAAEAFLPLTQAVPCGLIINELVTNAFKHAFEGRDRGEIRVEMSAADNGEVTVIVRDDGRGMPLPRSSDDWSTLGVQLVRGLASQLEGTLDFSTREGTTVTLRFRREEPPSAAVPTVSGAA